MVWTLKEKVQVCKFEAVLVVLQRCQKYMLSIYDTSYARPYTEHNIWDIRVSGSLGKPVRCFSANDML